MKYTVEITPIASSDIQSAFRYIHDRSPVNAEKWLRGIYKVISALEDFPHRGGIAPEATYLGENIRHRVFKSHRIIYWVDEGKKLVHILHVRHGSRRALGESDDEAHP